VKYIKWIVVTILFLIGAGFIAYHVGTTFVAEKVVQQVSVHLEENGELNNVLEEMKDNPELEKFLLNATSVDENTLPFTTKEEATKVLLKKVSAEELILIQSIALDGISIEDKGKLLRMFQNKLTEEELLALKVITVKELSN
jgi:hypothetical protein